MALAIAGEYPRLFGNGGIDLSSAVESRT